MCVYDQIIVRKPLKKKVISDKNAEQWRSTPLVSPASPSTATGRTIVDWWPWIRSCQPRLQKSNNEEKTEPKDAKLPGSRGPSPVPGGVLHTPIDVIADDRIAMIIDAVNAADACSAAARDASDAPGAAAGAYP